MYIYIFMYSFVCIYMYVYIYICICIILYRYYLFICIYILVYILMHIHILIHIYICITFLHDYETFRDHTHVKLHTYYIHMKLLQFIVTPQVDSLKSYYVKTWHLPKRVNFWVWDSLLPCLILGSSICGLPPPRGSGITMDDCPNRWRGCSRVFWESFFPLRSKGSGRLPQPNNSSDLQRLSSNLVFGLLCRHTASNPITSAVGTHTCLFCFVMPLHFSTPIFNF